MPAMANTSDTDLGAKIEKLDAQLTQMTSRVATLESMMAELIKRSNQKTLDDDVMRRVVTALILTVRDQQGGGYVYPIVNGQLTSIPHYVKELALVEEVVAGFAALKKCYSQEEPRGNSEPTYDLDFGVGL